MEKNATGSSRQTLRGNSDQVHKPWCNQAEHARISAEYVIDVPGCIGSEHVITLSGDEYAGYWRQQMDSNDVRLITEWPGLVFAEMPPSQVRSMYRVLLDFRPSRDVDQVVNMLGDALDELEGSDSWRDEL